LQFITFLKSLSIPLALATSLENDAFQAFIALPQFSSFIDDFVVIVTGDMVEHKKPSSDIFIKTLEQLNSNRDTQLQPDDCIVFEDSHAGVQAAQSAGMPVVYMPNPDIEFVEFERTPLLTAADFTDRRLRSLFQGGETHEF
jgi:HAD superfamily hydrolase (TIGR01509 family)